jgi:hypothetical protein
MPRIDGGHKPREAERGEVVEVQEVVVLEVVLEERAPDDERGEKREERCQTDSPAREGVG